jgi:hypothetical protein
LTQGPTNMRQAYELAYGKACRGLSQGDLGEICRRAGTQLNGRTLGLPFFGSRLEITVPPAGQEGEPRVAFNPGDLPLLERILVLHYLLADGRQPVSGKLVGFKNLPGAGFYDAAYQKRGPRRIARRFGNAPEQLEAACRALGWRREELGDVSCGCDVFPRVRAMVVLHLGDEELPPEAAILFNDDIVNCLPLEDVAVLAGLVATRLGAALKAPG